MNLRQCQSMLDVIMEYNQNGDSKLVTYLQNSICGYDGFDMMVCCPSPRFLTTTVAPLYFFTFAASSMPGSTFAPVNGNNNPQTFAPINFSPGPPINFTPGPSNAPPTAVQTYPAAVFPTALPPTNPPITISSILPTFERDRCGMSVWNYRQKFTFFLYISFIIFRSNATHSRVVGGLPAQTNAWPWIALVGYRNAFDSTPKFMCGGTLITQVWFGWVFGWFLVL